MSTPTRIGGVTFVGVATGRGEVGVCVHFAGSVGFHVLRGVGEGGSLGGGVLGLLSLRLGLGERLGEFVGTGRLTRGEWKLGRQRGGGRYCFRG